MDRPGSSQEEKDQADPKLWVLCSLCWLPAPGIWFPWQPWQWHGCTVLRVFRNGLRAQHP